MNSQGKVQEWLPCESSRHKAKTCVCGAPCMQTADMLGDISSLINASMMERLKYEFQSGFVAQQLRLRAQTIPGFTWPKRTNANMCGLVLRHGHDGLGKVGSKAS